MSKRGPNWLTIVLARGLFGLPGFSLTRFLLSLVLWSAVAVASVFGMLALILDSKGMIESAEHDILFRQPSCASRNRHCCREASDVQCLTR